MHDNIKDGWNFNMSDYSAHLFSESDSASESSNASSTIVRKGPAGKPKIKVKKMAI